MRFKNECEKGEIKISQELSEIKAQDNYYNFIQILDSENNNIFNESENFQLQEEKVREMYK